MIIDIVRPLLAAVLLVSVTATAGCRPGDSADASPSTAPPASSTPSVDLEQDTIKVCLLIVRAAGKGSSTALDDSKLLVNGQLTREEYARRLRSMFTSVAAELRQLGPRAADPTVRAAIERWATRMDEGASAPDPAEFFAAQYRVMLDEIDVTCKLG